MIYLRFSVAHLTLCGVLLSASACSDQPWLNVYLLSADSGTPWPKSLRVSVKYEDGDKEIGVPFDTNQDDERFSFYIPRDHGSVHLRITSLMSYEGRENCRVQIFSDSIAVDGSRHGKDVYLKYPASPTQIEPMRCNCDGHWCKEDLLVSGVNFLTIAGTAENNLWIAGSMETYLQYNHGNWQVPYTDPQGNGAIKSLYVSSDASVIRSLNSIDYLCGAKALKPEAGKNIDCPPLDVLFKLDSLTGQLSDNKIWAAGQDAGIGRIFEITTLGSWVSHQEAPDVKPLHGIWLRSNNDIWAVGESGSVLTKAGNTWSKREIPPTNTLNALWGLRDIERWAVGEGGIILHWTNPDWNLAPTEMPVTSSNLNAIWGSSEKDVWAVGNDGVILHFDGGAWKAQPSPTTANLHGIWGSNSENIWIVGDGNTVLLRDP